MIKKNAKTTKKKADKSKPRLSTRVTGDRVFAYVRKVVDSEGFDYAFRHYSEFPEVCDPRFHELRRAYVKAAADLEAHIGRGEES